MKDIYFLSLSHIPYLPYVYGLLRLEGEKDPEIRQNYNWLYPFTLVEESEKVLNRIHNPAILAASCYVWNTIPHLKICQKVKERWPECVTILGGPQIPDDAHGFLHEHPYVDIVVHGEGEETFAKILKQNLLSKPNWDQIAGITYRQASEISKTGPTSRVAFEQNQTSPYVAGYYNEAIRQHEEQQQPFMLLWETTRGCPFSCSYCDWGGGTMAKVRQAPLERLQAEIQFFKDFKIRDLELCDANFGLLERDIDIVQDLVSAKKQSGYPRTVHGPFSKVTNQRVLKISELLGEAKMSWATSLALQTMTKTSLQAVRRRNSTEQEYSRVVKAFEKQGLPYFTELILGLPGETKQSFSTGLFQVIENGGHQDLRIYECTLLPNAPLTREAERLGLKSVERFLFPKADAFGKLFDETEIPKTQVVIETPTMSSQEWAECYTLSKLIQILHNGGLCRFLSMYLRREQNTSYQFFYDKMLAHFSQREATVLGKVISKISSINRSYTVTNEVSQVGKAMADEEMRNFLASYAPRFGWTLWHWGWLYINAHLEQFYAELYEFMEDYFIFNTKTLEALCFQRDIIIDIEFDPKQGKLRKYKYNWFDYFAKDQDLKRQDIEIKYCDTHMGIDNRYPLAKQNKSSFIFAAIGTCYPWKKHGHYIHQFRTMRVTQKKYFGLNRSIIHEVNL